MDVFSYISAYVGTTRFIIANVIENLTKSASVVVITPNIKVYRSKVKFYHGPVGMKFDMEDL